MIIDFHAHIIPHADHGSKNVQTSIKQCEILKKAGVSHVVATPHFYPALTSVDDFISLRKRCCEKLINELKDNEIQITVGAEVLVCEQMENMKGIDNLTIDGTDCLLLEMPFSDRTPAIFDTIDNLSKNHLVVLAHIDRYPLGEVLNILECDNVFAQFNASALTSFIKNKHYMGLIDCDKVVAIGSDIHGSDEKYGKYMKKALSRLGEERTKRIMAHTADILQEAKYIN